MTKKKCLSLYCPLFQVLFGLFLSVFDLHVRIPNVQIPVFNFGNFWKFFANEQFATQFDETVDGE